MTPPKEKNTALSDTGRLRAIGEAVVKDATDRLLDDRKTPTGTMPTHIDHSESTDKMREVAREEANNKVTKHTLECLQPGGGLCTVAQKVDRLNRSVLIATGAVLLVGASLPFFWSQVNSRLQALDNLRIDVAALVAQRQQQPKGQP